MKKKKNNKKEEDNICWVDGVTECLIYKPMRCFFDAGPQCGKCPNFDKQRFINWYYDVVYPSE